MGFVLSKIGLIDPDVIIGHDVSGFDIEVLLHRTMVNKIPNWSRLGRLRRSVPLKGRFNEKQATTGRLVCDLKISAKELIRCKSYDLGALVEKLLGKAQEDRQEVDVDAMRKAYMSSKALLEVTSLSLQDAADVLQVSNFWIFRFRSYIFETFNFYVFPLNRPKRRLGSSAKGLYVLKGPIR